MSRVNRNLGCVSVLLLGHSRRLTSQSKPKPAQDFNPPGLGLDHVTVLLDQYAKYVQQLSTLTTLHACERTSIVETFAGFRKKIDDTERVALVNFDEHARTVMKQVQTAADACKVLAEQYAVVLANNNAKKPQALALPTPMSARFTAATESLVAVLDACWGVTTTIGDDHDQQIALEEKLFEVVKRMHSSMEDGMEAGTRRMAHARFLLKSPVSKPMQGSYLGSIRLGGGNGYYDALNNPIIGIAVRFDGEMIALSRAMTIEMYSLPDGALIASCFAKCWAPGRLCFAANGNILCIESANRVKEITTQGVHVVHVRYVGTKELYSHRSLFIDANSSVIAVGHEHAILVFDAVTGTFVREFTPPVKKIRLSGISLSPDGRLIATVNLSLQKLLVFDANTGGIVFQTKLWQSLVHTNFAQVCFTKCGKDVVIVAHADRFMRVVPIVSGQPYRVEQLNTGMHDDFKLSLTIPIAAAIANGRLFVMNAFHETVNVFH